MNEFTTTFASAYGQGSYGANAYNAQSSTGSTGGGGTTEGGGTGTKPGDGPSRSNGSGNSTSTGGSGNTSTGAPSQAKPTANGSSGGSLVDTGFIVLAVVVAACVITFIGLLVRFWKRPNSSDSPSEPQ